MDRILREPIENYLTQKQRPFAANQLANRLRNDFPKLITQIIPDQIRYKVVGSKRLRQITDELLYTKYPKEMFTGQAKYFYQSGASLQVRSNLIGTTVENDK